MTKIDIFSGFLGAGKTTLIKKLINEGYKGEKLMLIENEFGEIGIDGGFLKDSGIEINEMNSGCICCSLVGDFSKALKKAISDYAPDRILIEPSGVGKLSDVIRAVRDAGAVGAELGSFTTVADVTKCRMYMKNFGEFYNDQIENACTIILSRTDDVAQAKIDAAVAMLREHNKDAVIITTPWDKLTGLQILTAMEDRPTLAAELERLAKEEAEEHHHHDHDDDDDDDEHEHEHHHHDGEECSCGHHHDHDDDDDDEHEHHHHHDGEECSCGHHHHHHADDVFTSWGAETTHKFTKEQIEKCLEALEDEKTYGAILRAKGIVEDADGSWIHYDYVPGCPDVRTGSADITGRLCVIGSKIDTEKLAELFGVNA